MAKNPIIAKNPRELLNWMDKNLIYNGVSKKYLYTADDVLKNKKAHCWESSELEYIELTKMGYKCELLYLEDKDVKVTHTAVLYSANDSWYWFEWAWFKYAGIHSNYIGDKKNDQLSLIRNIVSKFIKANGNCNIIRLGYVPITEKMTQIEYRERILKLKTITLGNSRPLYAKW